MTTFQQADEGSRRIKSCPSHPHGGVDNSGHPRQPGGSRTRALPGAAPRPRMPGAPPKEKGLSSDLGSSERKAVRAADTASEMVTQASPTTTSLRSRVRSCSWQRGRQVARPRQPSVHPVGGTSRLSCGLHHLSSPSLGLCPWYTCSISSFSPSLYQQGPCYQ